MRLRTVLVAALASLLAGASPALADEPDAATRAATTLSAVQLAEEAGELFQAGKFVEALDRYQRADALVKRHTIGLRIARCLVKLGRLSEAAERYQAVTRMALPADLEPDKLAKQKDALAQAESERDALLPRIPHVIVQLTGPSDAVVTLDGQRFPAALFGVKRAIDPGAHHVEARAGAEVVARDLTVKEGEVVTVPLELHAAAVVVPPPADSRPLPPVDTGKGRRTAGYVLVGVGGAGLVLGVVAGIGALLKKSDLQQTKNCGQSLQCPPALQGEADSYNSLRGVSALGVWAGAAVAATGIVLVVTGLPPKEGQGAKAASLFVGPASAGVRGVF